VCEERDVDRRRPQAAGPAAAAPAVGAARVPARRGRRRGRADGGGGGGPGLGELPWQAAYAALWETSLAIQLGRFGIEADLRHWVDDGLMTLFFLVVGLEINVSWSTASCGPGAGRPCRWWPRPGAWPSRR
jgi:Na+/H+ antiporter 1